MMENGRLDFRGLLLLALLPPLPRRGRVLSGPQAPPRFFGVLLQLLPAVAGRPKSPSSLGILSYRRHKVVEAITTF